MPDEALIERLSQKNPQFRRLKEDHRKHDEELEWLNARSRTHGFLPADQQLRASELKKLKLLAKDRMEAMIRQARRQTTDAVLA